MTRIKLAYVHEFIDRHGHVRRYFRRPGFKLIPLPGLPGSTEFMAAYQATLEIQPLAIGEKKRSKPGSASAAIAGYYTSLEFRSLAPGTRAMRGAILERFRREHGEKPIALLHSRFIAATLNKMTPHVARSWLKTLRGLVQFCLAQENAQYEVTHPVGSMARLAIALGLYTGQRRGDVVRMGRQHIHEGLIGVRQEKTKAPLKIPIHAELQVVLDAASKANLTFLVTRRGRPYVGNDFSEQFRLWCNEAGLPEKCVFHGLRKAACRRLAEAGCSASEIASISGHATLREVERYVKEADQERMARNAMARVLTGVSGTDKVQGSGNPDRSKVATPLNSLKKSAKR
jgi:integrase